MAVVFEGSRAVDATEWCTIANSAGPTSQTTPQSFMMLFDTSALTGTDVVIEIRVYEKVLSSSTQRLAMEPIVVSAGVPTVPIPFLCYEKGYSVTIKRLSGSTTPTVAWSGRKPG